MQQNTSFKFCIFFCLVVSVFFNSCEKKYDAPPSVLALAFAPDLSIKDLRAKHTMGKFEQITDAKLIVGVVVANDQSDNFYKSIVVQDTSGGITVRMDGIKLDANFPVGRKIAIKLKDLWLGDYGKMIQLGIGVDNADPTSPTLMAIPQTLFDQYIIRGERVNNVAPMVVAISNLNNNYQSMLVQLDQVEFAPMDTAKTYGDAINKLSINRTIRACNGSTILLRTSGYANFANAKTPVGNGSIVGIYSVFGTTKQLAIRDSFDVNLKLPRCK
jgi:hypothetical protein